MGADRETDVARLAEALAASVPGRPGAPVVRIWGRAVDDPDVGAEANLWAGTPMDVAELILPVVDAIAAERAQQRAAEVWSLAASWVGPPFAKEFRDRAAALRADHA